MGLQVVLVKKHAFVKGRNFLLYVIPACAGMTYLGTFMRPSKLDIREKTAGYVHPETKDALAKMKQPLKLF
jgi:hypothetical protein